MSKRKNKSSKGKKKQAGSRKHNLRESPYDLKRQDSSETDDFVPMIKRVKPLQRSSSFANLSVDFADEWVFSVFYGSLVVGLTLILLPFSPLFHVIPSVTLVNIAHAVFTFYLMHWRKGTMDSFDQGELDKGTFWELFDHGRHYTKRKKFFTIVPILLFLAACYEQEWKKRIYFFNLVALGFCLVPKHPWLFGIRFFGVNS